MKTLKRFGTQNPSKIMLTKIDDDDKVSIKRFRKSPTIHVGMNESNEGLTLNLI